MAQILKGTFILVVIDSFYFPLFFPFFVLLCGRGIAGEWRMSKYADCI